MRLKGLSATARDDPKPTTAAFHRSRPSVDLSRGSLTNRLQHGRPSEKARLGHGTHGTPSRAKEANASAGGTATSRKSPRQQRNSTSSAGPNDPLLLVERSPDL